MSRMRPGEWRAAVLTRGETALEDDAARVYAEEPDGH